MSKIESKKESSINRSIHPSTASKCEGIVYLRALLASFRHHDDTPYYGPDPTNKRNEKLTTTNEDIRQVVRHEAGNHGSDSKEDAVGNAQANQHPAIFHLGGGEGHRLAGSFFTNVSHDDEE